MQKATEFNQIKSVIAYNLEVDPTHPFYVDFSNFRGKFKESVVYRELNFNPIEGKFIAESTRNNILFFMGQRGSGKTTEFKKIVSKVSGREAFLVVNCNIDSNLNLSDLDLSDIALFILEELSKTLLANNINSENANFIKAQQWFNDNIKERIKSSKLGIDIESGVEMKAAIPFFATFTSKLRGFWSSTEEVKKVIRETITKNFSEFANHFSLFVDEATRQVQSLGIAKEILIIADGIEKAMSQTAGTKIFIQDAERIHLLRANIIYGFPYYLDRNQPAYYNIKTIRFPLIKIKEKDGTHEISATNQMVEMIYRRIDSSLFDSEETVKYIVNLSGGHPRELLNIIGEAWNFADFDSVKIERIHVDKAMEQKSAQLGRLEDPELEILKSIHASNLKNEAYKYTSLLDTLIQKGYLYEYNDGSYLRANPVLELSQQYRQYVLGEN